MLIQITREPGDCNTVCNYHIRRRAGMKRAVLFLLLTLVAASAARAQDAERGRDLYENHCQGCHSSQAHIREARKVRTPQDLSAWVRRWQRNQSLNWGEEEVSDVAAFLDREFYHFPGKVQ
jgi:cytochrome c5